MDLASACRMMSRKQTQDLLRLLKLSLEEVVVFLRTKRRSKLKNGEKNYCFAWEMIGSEKGRRCVNEGEDSEQYLTFLCHLHP